MRKTFSCPFCDKAFDRNERRALIAALELATHLKEDAERKARETYYEAERPWYLIPLQSVKMSKLYQK